MENPRPRSAHVLMHLLPADVLRQANALAQRLQRDELFRSYVVKHAWFVIPAAILATFLILGFIVAAMLFALQLFSQPVEPFVRYTVVLIGALAWLTFTIWMLYGFFSWLEKRALQKHIRLV